MKQIDRKIPDSTSKEYTLKNIAVNDLGKFFLIFRYEEPVITERKDKKKVTIEISRFIEKEMIIALNDTELGRLKKFLAGVEI